MKTKTINFSALVTLFFMILSTIPVDARNLSFDISYYKVFNNSSSVELFDIPDIVSVCITKQNYIPKHFTLTLIQDLTINENINISSNIVRIGSNVNPTKSTGNVNIINGNVVIEADTIEIENGFEVSKGASVQLLTK